MIFRLRTAMYQSYLLILIDIIAGGCESLGCSFKPKSKVTFLPLIDKTPSDSSRILTVMHETERIIVQANQEFLVFTLNNYTK